MEMNTNLERPNLSNLLDSALWRELVRGDMFGSVCERASAYYAMVTYYCAHHRKLLGPFHLLPFLWYFYKAKREAHIAWQMIKGTNQRIRESEQDILCTVMKATLLGFFGKPKRARKIREHHYA